MNKQMTRRVLDKTQILLVFAQYLAKKHGGNPDEYLADHIQLDDLVKNDKAFPWQDIAVQVNLDRWRLYHWYFETFQRMLAGSIEKDDVTLMTVIFYNFFWNSGVKFYKYYAFTTSRNVIVKYSHNTAFISFIAFSSFLIIIQFQQMLYSIHCSNYLFIYAVYNTSHVIALNEILQQILTKNSKLNFCMFINLYFQQPKQSWAFSGNSKIFSRFV
ncbi:Conserved_hypothetical protein [Hexamita inflata]|uniref:Uncharacterized protein n=1 Tax=Hexamita inflata TaxID=28002 RepID=A0ABP1JA70_9EUKA